MKLRVVTTDPAEVKVDAVVMLLSGKAMTGRSENAMLQKHVDSYGKAAKDGSTKGEWFCTVEKEAGAKTPHLLLDNADSGPWMPGRESLKTAAARAVATCRRYSLSKIAFAVQTDDAEADALAILEGVALGDFSDTRFKGDSPKRAPIELSFIVSDNASAIQKTLKAHLPVIDGVNFARELVNAPSNILNPTQMAKEARAIAKGNAAVTCTVLSKSELKKQGYNLILAVGDGADDDPCMIVLQYRPAKAKKKTPHLALVGKGVCFDTGGLCIKPSGGMHTMNGDMGGAAAVLGAMHAIAKMKPNVRVTAVVPAVINGVDDDAMRPGAIYKAKNGKTVYIENTDAEGRLILADAFNHPAVAKADVLLDFATLTGAAGVALGPVMGAVFTDDEELRGKLTAAGDATGDSAWPLPLWREYEPGLEHTLADLNNVSSIGRYGGAIHAALFLKQFVPDGPRWAHFDMSAAARAKSPTRYYGAGGTGWGVRLILRALQDLG